MLCMLMTATMVMTASCGSSEEEEGADVLNLSEETSPAMTLTLWGIKGEGTTDAAVELVEAEINKLTKARYNTAIELQLFFEDEYLDALNERLDTIEANIQAQKEAEKAAKKAAKEAKKNGTAAATTTAAETTVKEDETMLDENGLVVTKYPEVGENQLDIFLITDYEMLNSMNEKDVLSPLDEQISGDAKLLKSYIHPTFIEAGKVGGKTVAILNQQQAGEATYMLVDKAKLNELYEASVDEATGTGNSAFTIEYIAENKIRNATNRSEIGQFYFRNAETFIAAAAETFAGVEGFEALKGDHSPIAVNYFVTEEDKAQYEIDMVQYAEDYAAYEAAMVVYEEEKKYAEENGLSLPEAPEEPIEPMEPKSLFGMMLNPIADSYGATFAPTFMLDNNTAPVHYYWLTIMKKLELKGGYDEEIETKEQLLEEGNFAVAIIKGGVSDVAMFEPTFVKYAEENSTYVKESGVLPPYYTAGENYYVIQLQEPVADSNEIYNGAFAVSAYSKDVNRSMEIITYLNTREDIRNLFGYGVEGVHYSIDEDTGVLTRLNNEYNMKLEYTGNTFIAHAPEGVEAIDANGLEIDYWSDSKMQNLTLDLNPFFNFKMFEGDVDMGYYEDAMEFSEEFYRAWDEIETAEEIDTLINDYRNKFNGAKANNTTILEDIPVNYRLQNWISEAPDFESEAKQAEANAAAGAEEEEEPEDGEATEGEAAEGEEEEEDAKPVTLYSFYTSWFNKNIH